MAARARTAGVSHARFAERRRRRDAGSLPPVDQLESRRGEVATGLSPFDRDTSLYRPAESGRRAQADLRWPLAAGADRRNETKRRRPGRGRRIGLNGTLADS